MCQKRQICHTIKRKSEKSIRGFCPHLWCGTRQSLAKKWPQRSGGNHSCSSGDFWGNHFPITTEKRAGHLRISDGKWSTSCQSLVKVPSYTHQKMCVFLEKPTRFFSRKFGNVLCLKRSALHTKKGNVLQKNQSQQGFNNGWIKFVFVLCCFGKVCTQKERYCLKNGVKNIRHESTVSGTKVSIKELTHSLHPKPIDSNKPRLFAPAEGAAPEDRG